MPRRIFHEESLMPIATTSAYGAGRRRRHGGNLLNAINVNNALAHVALDHVSDHNLKKVMKWYDTNIVFVNRIVSELQLIPTPISSKAGPRKSNAVCSRWRFSQSDTCSSSIAESNNAACSYLCEERRRQGLCTTEDPVVRRPPVHTAQVARDEARCSG